VLADLNLLRLDGSDGVHWLQPTVLRKGHGHRLQGIRKRTHRILRPPEKQPHRRRSHTVRQADGGSSSSRSRALGLSRSRKHVLCELLDVGQASAKAKGDAVACAQELA